MVPMRAGWIVVVVWLAGCYVERDVTCGDMLCPSTLMCSPDHTCVEQQQLTACAMAGAGSLCNYNNVQGFCHDGTCLTTLDVCGDGVTSPALGELCDCGDASILAAAPVGCNGFNSDLPGATCRSSCKPARCGDGILDPGELCDDGNNVSFDGCRADCQGRFEKMQTPTAQYLNAVWTFATGEAFAVGNANTTIYYDGTNWAEVSLGASANSLSSVWASSVHDVYVGGNAGLFHSSGPTNLTVVLSQVGIKSIWGTSATNVFAVGYSGSASNTAAALYHTSDGSQWSSVALTGCLPSGTTYSQVDAVWTSGISNTYIAVEYELTIAGPSTYLLCYSSNGTWSVAATFQTLQRVVSLAGDSTGTVYALRASGIIEPFTAGIASMGILVPGDLDSFGFSTNDELLGVGGSGVILHYNVTTHNWTHLVSPTELQLAAIAATSPQNVFIVGQAGTVLH